MNDEENEEQAIEGDADFIWYDDEVARKNYIALGKRLALSSDLFRSPQHGRGLIQIQAGNFQLGRHVMITKAAELLPVIVDRVDVLVKKDGRVKGKGRLSARTCRPCSSTRRSGARSLS